MSKGIIVYGANGSGKSTLGRVLARVLSYRHMDVEDYYFEKSEMPYSISRAKDEVIKLMLDDINTHGSFVLSAVTGEFGVEVEAFYEFAVYISTPLEIRLDRIKYRAIEKFGKRVIAGGDLFEQEHRFFEFVRNRDVFLLEEWGRTLNCPIIEVDGTKPISESIKLIVERYNAFKDK